MSNQKVTKENAIASVQSSVSSIFSKEDVIFLINSIEDKKAGITEQRVLDSVYSIMSELKNNRSRIVDSDDIEFELDYNKTIKVNDVPIDMDYISDVITEELQGLVQFEEEEPSNEDEFEQEAREIEFIEQDGGKKSIDEYVSKCFKTYGGSEIFTVSKSVDGICTITWDGGDVGSTYNDEEVIKYFEDGTWRLV
jgi:hypothetical protein